MHDSHDLVDHVLDRDARRIDRDGVCRADEGRRRARPVAPIARLQSGGHFRERCASPSRRVQRIERSTACAFLGRGVQEDLDVSIRKHDGPDVAPLDDDASLLAQLALLSVEHLAHPGLAGDGRGRRVDLGSANRFRDVLSIDPRDAVAYLQLETLGDRGHRCLVCEINPIAQRLPGDSSVHGARVDVPVFETCRDGTRDRTLAGARGSVDSDDETVAHTTAIILAMRRSRTTALTFVAVALVLALGGFVAEYARGAAFVARAAGATGLVRSVADWHRQAVTESSIEIAWRAGSLRGHRYQPTRATGRPLLLVPGVHASGIDEPRLIGFARELASMGHTTVTAELSDLAHYSVTSRSTDMIEDAALWLLQQPDLPADGRIGMIGISFAGGLSIVAAGRPRLRDRVAFVLSFGGHGDLPRTLHYLATGLQPDGMHRPPHDYGVAIILLGVAERVVPESQAPALRAAILSFLEASRLDMVDKEQASREFAHARTLADTLPEPSRTLMTYVNNRDVAHLGPILEPHLTALGGDPALSPDHSPPPTCQVYLLHGMDDNVIPAIESALLARTLRDRGVNVRFLATPMVTHASVEHSALASSAWDLVRFWSAVLDD